MSDSPAPARPLATWMGVLDHIERSLASSLSQTPLPADAPPEGPDGTAAALERLDGKLAAWRDCVERAEANATEAEALAAREAEALADWRQRQQAARERLTAWVTRQG